jgi:hypothetical protein
MSHQGDSPRPPPWLPLRFGTSPRPLHMPGRGRLSTVVDRYADEIGVAGLHSHRQSSLMRLKCRFMPTTVRGSLPAHLFRYRFSRSLGAGGFSGRSPYFAASSSFSHPNTGSFGHWEMNPCHDSRRSNPGTLNASDANPCRHPSPASRARSRDFSARKHK